MLSSQVCDRMRILHTPVAYVAACCNFIAACCNVYHRLNKVITPFL